MIFQFSHANEFVGKGNPATQPARASPTPEPGRWVCEEGGSASYLQGAVPAKPTVITVVLVVEQPPDPPGRP